MKKIKKFLKNFDFLGCGVFLLLVIIATLGVLTSCCDVCEQGAPPLRPMPPCGVYYVEDVIEIPVENSGK